MKKLIRANSLYIGISLLSSSSAFLLIPLYISHFSVSEYGELALMNVTFSLLAIVLTLSIESAYQTFYFDHNTEEEPEYFKSIYCFALLTLAVTVGLLAILGDQLFELIFTSEFIHFYPNGMLITASTGFALLNQIYFVRLRNQEKIKRFGRFVAINTLLSASLQVFLIVVLDLGVTGAILGALVGNAVIFLLTLRKTGCFDFKVRFELIKPSLKYCIWLLPFFLIEWFLGKGDRMIVENFLGLEEVGLYALLMNVSMILSLAVTSVLNALRPPLFRELKKLRGGLTKASLQIIMYFFAVLLLTAVVLYIGVQFIDQFNIFQAYLKVQEYILLALLLFAIRGIVRLLAEYLSFRKKSKDLFVISVVNLLCFLPMLIYFMDELNLTLLLNLLIFSNSVALLATFGRSYYLLKTDDHTQST